MPFSLLYWYLSVSVLSLHGIGVAGLQMAAAVTTAHRSARGGGIIFRQFFEKESSTYTYLLACEETREAILIDPVDVTVTRDLGMIKDLKLKLVKVLNTHVHAGEPTSPPIHTKSQHHFVSPLPPSPQPTTFSRL